MLNNLLAIAWQRRTYLRILYLLLTFPLGMFYFVFLLTLVSVGVGTALIAGIVPSASGTSSPIGPTAPIATRARVQTPSRSTVRLAPAAATAMSISLRGMNRR